MQNCILIRVYARLLLFATDLIYSINPASIVSKHPLEQPARVACKTQASDSFVDKVLKNNLVLVGQEQRVLQVERTRLQFAVRVAELDAVFFTVRKQSRFRRLLRRVAESLKIVRGRVVFHGLHSASCYE